MKALKYIALLLSYLTISPLLLILDRKWQLLPKWLRITSFILSPLMLIIMGIALFISIYWYKLDYYPRHHFVRPRVIENITGVRLPKYKVIKYDKGVEYEKSRLSFLIDYTDEFVLEFKEMPSEEFYQQLHDKYDHHKNENGITEYSFYCMWGNGLPAPKGESESDDYTFSIKILKDSKTFYIKSGAW